MSDNKQEQVEKLLEGLDLSDLAFQLSQLALKAVSGQQIETVEYDVKLSVPQEIANVVEKLCADTDVEPSTIFTTMASSNFNAAIRAKIQESTQQKSQDQQAQDVAAQVAAATGFDSSKLMEGMSQMKGLAESLQGLQGILENAAKAANATNPAQPNVPDRQVSGNEGGTE